MGYTATAGCTPPNHRPIELRLIWMPTIIRNIRWSSWTNSPSSSAFIEHATLLARNSFRLIESPICGRMLVLSNELLIQPHHRASFDEHHITIAQKFHPMLLSLLSFIHMILPKNPPIIRKLLVSFFYPYDFAQKTHPSSECYWFLSSSIWFWPKFQKSDECYCFLSSSMISQKSVHHTNAMDSFLSFFLKHIHSAQ